MTEGVNPLCNSAPPSLPEGGGGLCNSGRQRRPDDVARGYPLTLFPLCNSAPWRRWQRRDSDFCMEWALFVCFEVIKGHSRGTHRWRVG